MALAKFLLTKLRARSIAHKSMAGTTSAGGWGKVMKRIGLWTVVVLGLTGCPGGAGDENPNPTPTAGCQESWVCSSWETDGIGDAGTRTCVDENACGTTTLKPTETATLPPLDENYFRCNVKPTFDAKCSHLGCHGTEQGRALKVYHRGRLRVTGEILVEPGCLSQGTQIPSENCIGSIECVCWSVPLLAIENRKNYDSARGFALYEDGAAIAAADMDDSELLTQPKFGGKPHVDIHVFAQGDAEYTAIRDWLNGATQAACNFSN